MAEALAVVGLASAIVQFVDFGTKVVKRLSEFSVDLDDVPRTFREINSQLPLIINMLRQTKAQADAQDLSEDTAKALKAIAEECILKVKQLEKILIRALPTNRVTTWKRGAKAIASLRHDKAVADIQGTLERNLRLLTDYQTINTASLIANLPEGPAPQPAQTVTQAADIKPCFMVRFEQDPTFVGREDEIREINAQFEQQQHRVVLSGIGGVGKSQIAIEYCYRYRSKHPEAHIFWVYGGSHARFEESYQQIAADLTLPGFDDPNQQTLKLVQDWLNINDGTDWLMILDNVDDMDIVFGEKHESPRNEKKKELIEYLPRSSAGLILITTRDRRLGERLVPGKKPIAVEAFNTQDARILLDNKLPKDDDRDGELSQQLLRALDYLPLAITQATAFMTENEISVAGYLEILRSDESEMIEFLATDMYDPNRDSELSNSVLHTWKVSFDKIKVQKPQAADLLSLMSCLDRQAISEALLVQDGDGSRLGFVAAIGTLKAFSLIKSEHGNKVFGMHRLVQLATQRWLEIDGSIGKWQDKALFSVRNSMPTFYHGATLRDWEAINPHIVRVLNQDGANKSRSEEYWLERASILFTHAEYHKVQGSIVTARYQHLECLSYREEFLEPNDVDVIESMMSVSRNYAVEDAGDGESLVRQALERCENIVDDDVRYDLAWNASFTLGRNLSRQGRWLEAERIFRKVYTDCIGYEDEQIAHSHLIYALSRQKGEKLAEAETHHQRMMFTLTKEDYTNAYVLSGLQNNVNYLNVVRRYDDALALSARVVEGYRGSVGENHLGFRYSLYQCQCILDKIENRNRSEGASEEESSALCQAVKCQLSESDESLTPFRDQDMEERN